MSPGKHVRRIVVNVPTKTVLSKTEPSKSERLSRDAITTSALALADAEGIEAVTIRRLAKDHGVTPMALYWHFKDKDLLLDGIVERLLTELDLPPADPAGPWDEELRRLLAAMLEVFAGHPGVADLVGPRFMNGPAGLELTERALDTLARAGFSPAEAVPICHQALNVVVSLVTMNPNVRIGPDEAACAQAKRTKAARLQALPPEQYPRLIEAGPAFAGFTDETAYYRMGIDMFIHGVRGIRPAGRP
jgi:TetR/AcrR family tetracycline transcriptional repressor